MRKLTLCCISFAAAVFISNYLLTEYWELGLFLFFAAAAVFLLIKFRGNARLYALALFLIYFSVGIGMFFANVQLKKVPASELDGKTVEAVGRVVSFPTEYDDYSKIDIVLKAGKGPALNTILYDREGLISSLKPGNIIHFNAGVKSADVRYGKDYDVYNAKDIFLTADIDSGYSVDSRKFVSFRTVSAQIARYISGLVEAVFPQAEAPFMKSLMLGDKTDFYNDDAHYVALSRAGLMHIVAVSGMHVAFVVTIIQLLFGAGKLSSIAGIVLVWSFVLVSGASPSAVRAGIMQTVLLLAPLLKRENDPITSLSFALALILAVNPFSCASISLQLSFSAMAGLVLFAEKIKNSFALTLKNRILNAAAEFITDVFSASAAVMIFSLPLTAVHFGTVSVLSPVSNILALWSVSFCFGGGYLSVLLGAVFLPAGKIAGTVVSILVKYIYSVSSLISSFRYSVVYTQDKLVILWLVFTYLLICLGIFARGNTGLKIISVIFSSVLVISVFLHETNMYYSTSPGFYTAVNVGQGQCICAFSGDTTVVVDCGTSNYGLGNAGDKAAAYLLSRGRDSVDYLILTHFHSDHADGVVRLINSMPVRNIVVAYGLDDPDGCFADISAAAQDKSVNIVFLTEHSLLTAGNMHIELYPPQEEGDQNERSMFTLISVDDYDMMITGDAPKSIERLFAGMYETGTTEVLVVGHHGSRYSSSGEFLEKLGGDTALISVGYNNYGHPTGETLDRLYAYGYRNIYRTDLNGTVEIPVGIGY